MPVGCPRWLSNQKEENMSDRPPATEMTLEQRANLKKLIVDIRKDRVSFTLGALGDFTSLKVLDLSYLGLESLPPSIGKLKMLKRLYVIRNEITSLPEEIGELLELKTLFCAYNRLTSLPRSLGKLVRLKVLSCHSNEITRFPSSMGNLSPGLKFHFCGASSIFGNPLDPESLFDSWEELREHLRKLRRELAAARALRVVRAFSYSSRTCASSDSHSPFALLPNDMVLAVMGLLDEEGTLENHELRDVFAIGFQRPRPMDREEFMEALAEKK